MMRWTWDGVATINALCPVGDYWLQSRLTAVDLPRGVRRKELTSEKKCPAAIKGKKDYWTSKSVAHGRISGESRSQSRPTPSAVLEDTLHLVDLFLSPFAPSWIAKGSMRSISMTIAHPTAQVAGCSGALRAITVRPENARSRVLAGPRDSGRHFASKCSHCACSVSHERGPNARCYVKSPPPPPPPKEFKLGQRGLCAYIIIHTILPPSPVILCIQLSGKPKWLPLKSVAYAEGVWGGGGVLPPENFGFSGLNGFLSFEAPYPMYFFHGWCYQ